MAYIFIRNYLLMYLGLFQLRLPGRGGIALIFDTPPLILKLYHSKKFSALINPPPPLTHRKNKFCFTLPDNIYWNSPYTVDKLY